jgi:hypothetical protein
MPDANDMDLLQEFARHNSGTAFAELVRRLINLVYSVALRFTGNPGDVQDVTQAVIDPAKPMLKLGLDVHLEFIMSVVQKDHGQATGSWV